MLVSVLSSGSKGNVTFVETEQTKILIDAGRNLKYIEEKLNELNRDISEINYILISHTHSDHTSALKSIIKKNKPIIILTDLMYQDLKFLEDYENVLFLEDNMQLNDVLLENIKTSHDASDSRGFIISTKDASVVQVTDTGYLNQKHFSKLTNKDIYIFESNHNVEMLMNGKYPKWLKTRVNSDVGHLSNDSSAFYLSKIIGPKTKQIILAHLSEENNTPELALETLQKELKDKEINFSNIVIANQEYKTEPFII